MSINGSFVFSVSIQLAGQIFILYIIIQAFTKGIEKQQQQHEGASFTTTLPADTVDMTGTWGSTFDTHSRPGTVSLDNQLIILVPVYQKLSFIYRCSYLITNNVNMH